ncbi:hypothetical protein CROQUDRAFT_657063 [Cronartium quercuum f. sp. fusiforme G11]|uniref:Trafficking protein particle complex subunit 13 n=1 Tax=Cronartium quercuum f. sp. fusiforme G11 TaxID=708437 RepID=A0A9P6TDG2_9BASI|nr:hypothetical protein CROQUDRAFT_657063 [Cronartium quercuum f. sp. fusiforme G11]
MSTNPSSHTQPRPPSSSPPHLLAIKVLRAARPTFHHPPIHHCPTQYTLDIPPLPSFEPASSTSLTLPNSFGLIHLGQTFHGLVSVQHEGDGEPAENAVLRVEMHTTANKIQLAEIGPSRVEFGKPGLELAVKHEIKELGLHTLVCTVSYDQVSSLVKSSDEKAEGAPVSTGQVSRNFRKLYKFQVSNPLSVKTKVFVPTNAHQASVPLPSAINASFSSKLRNLIYLEVQIMNQTPQPIVFEHVKLIPPTEQLEELEYNDLNLERSTGLLPRSLSLLYAGDASQFLFSIVHPTNETTSQELKPIQVLGRLDLAWRGKMGEPGKVQTSALTRKLNPPPTEVNSGSGPELLVEDFDRASIQVGKPFKVTYLIRFPSKSQSHSTLSLTFQHLPFNYSLSDSNSLNQTSSATPNTDWSLKDSLASLLTTNKRSNISLEPSSPKNQNFNNSQSQLNSRLITSRESNGVQPPLITLGPEINSLTGSEDKNEYKFCLNYLAFEIGLWSLGGIRLISKELNGTQLIIGEWNEVGYIWCAAATT